MMNNHNTTQRFYTVFSALACCALLCSTSVSAGGIGLGATRLVYSQQAGQTAVTVRNTNTKPYLVNARISRTLTGRETTPFFVSPPLFRLEAGSNALLRITGNAQSLPQDRESVFFLTVAGIPSSNPLARDNRDGFSDGGLVYAVGNTIKLFYRPSGLPSSAADAAKGLRFTQSGGRIQADNPTPYYVSLMTLRLNGRLVDLEAGKTDMIAPFSSANWPAGMPYPLSQAGKVSWSAVVNLGEVVDGTATL
ncbi:TPA: molecular chaperone [Serratia marcescens]|nr:MULTISPECIES: molecular chaperone [Serratia]MBH2928679.1 molecular chaperone [Serratia ureilytica]